MNTSDYICYLSRQKVDLLFEQLKPNEVDEILEKRETTAQAKASGSASVPFLVALFKGELSFGRKNVIQTEKKTKKRYFEKLQTIIWDLEEKSMILPYEQILDSNQFVSNYFSYSGEFRVKTALDDNSTLTSSKVVTLESSSNNDTLLMDCSLRNFSDGNADDGTFHTHSGNHAFFSGTISLYFETVAVLLNRDQNTIHATPLMLILRFPSDVSANNGLLIL